MGVCTLVKPSASRKEVRDFSTTCLVFSTCGAEGVTSMSTCLFFARVSGSSESGIWCRLGASSVGIALHRTDSWPLYVRCGWPWKEKRSPLRAIVRSCSNASDAKNAVADS